MATPITNPVPRRVWSARNSEMELRDLEILDPAEYNTYPVGDGSIWEMTSTVAVRTNGLGVLMYERIPYLVEADASQSSPEPNSRRGKLYSTTYADHALRLAASFARSLQYRGFVVHYDGVQSEFYTVDGFTDFDQEKMTRELEAIYPYAETNYLTNPESYGIVDGSELKEPGRYLYGMDWWTPQGQMRSTMPMALPENMQRAIMKVYGLKTPPWASLQESTHAARFCGWIRAPGWDAPLQVWGWTSVHRLYADLGTPVEFVLGQ